MKNFMKFKMSGNFLKEGWNGIYRNIEVYRELNKSGKQGKCVMITEGRSACLFGHMLRHNYSRNNFIPLLKQYSNDEGTYWCHAGASLRLNIFSTVSIVGRTEGSIDQRELRCSRSCTCTGRRHEGSVETGSSQRTPRWICSRTSST